MDDGTFNAKFLFINEEETGDEGETVEIQGNFPTWVNGTVFTVGPGKFHFQESGFTVNQIGDGYGIICKLAISGRKITLWKKYIQSDALRKANEAGKPVLAEVFTPSSTDVTKSPLGRLMSLLPEPSDNTNHGIYFFGNKIYTNNGLQYFREIHPKDLSSGIKYDSNKFGISSAGLHPLIDYDGTMYNTGSAISATGSKQKIFKIPGVKPGETFKDSVKKIKVLATMANRMTHSHIHHSFGMSENFLVIVEQPYVLNATKMLGWMLSGGPAKLNDFIEWHPNEVNRFVIVEKTTGKILKRKFESSEPFFFLHAINCYEENNQLIFDVLAYLDSSLIDELLLKALIDGTTCCNSEKRGIFKRFVLPLAENFEGGFGSEITLRADDTVIVKAGCMSEPGLQHTVTINPKYRFRKYRFAYGNSWFYLQGPYANKITKIDLRTGEETAWAFGEECLFGEIIFIPNPDGFDEDDGILLSGVSSGFRNGGQQRFLVFVCAKTMVEIGRAEFKNHISIYMHGVYVPSMF